MGTEASHISNQEKGAPLRVFWRPGCSSCARVKEYLTKQGVAFESVDVAQDPDGLRLLADLGIRSVPVVMRGREFTFAQSLDDVSNFLSLSATATERLGPEELMARWRYFLVAARTLVGRIPEESWNYEHVPEQSLLFVSHHIFRIPLSFLACVQDGVQEWVPVAMAPPPPGARAGFLRELADEVDGKLDRWWAALEDKSCSWPVVKYDGVHSAHVFLERQVWHTAHHTRQLASALEALRVDVAGVIDSKQYDGLPMPTRVW